MKMQINPDNSGFIEKLREYAAIQKPGFETGRIIAEHKERYIVRTAESEFEAEITGNMRFSAKSREDFPVVGDWVSIIVFDHDLAVIHDIFPRSSLIKRQSVSNAGDSQVIAANIDSAFLVQAAGRDFNINRLERYITICNSAKVAPVIVLSKTDLFEEQIISEMVEMIKQRIKNIPVIAISNATQNGYSELKSTLEKGKTYCMLGSSGAGKSTLINNLAGRQLMKTGEISESTNKGRHVTSHRELVIVENGAMLIDNPGMREVGIGASADGLDDTFDKITLLSKDCRYADCTHTRETGCAVIEAVEKGGIDRNSYENYLKMEREKAHYESTIEERRRKDKVFGKMMKNYKKNMKKK